MNDLENQLQDTLHSTREAQTRGLSGPAVRRAARTRTIRFRTGGIAAVGAAGAVAVLVAPGLFGAPTSTSVSPGAQPSADAAKKSIAAAPPTTSGTGKAPAVPVQAYVWAPAGSLIDDPTVLSHAPTAAGSQLAGPAHRVGRLRRQGHPRRLGPALPAAAGHRDRTRLRERLDVADCRAVYHCRWCGQHPHSGRWD